MSAAELKAALEAAQDKKADIDLLQGAIGIESVTGNETRFAAFLSDQLNALGMAANRGAFDGARENVWAVTRDVKGGRDLMILGHTDTVHTRGWREYWKEDSRANPYGGAIVDGKLWGRGACDLKGGICAAIAGYRLLRTAGYELEGRLSFAFIGDEESGEPGSGVSAGAKDLVERVKAGSIPKPDFAVYVEPTSLDVYTAQIGFFIADIVITGKSAYFGTPELGVDALKASHKVLSEIWAHEEELAKGARHELLGSSSILVTSFESGGFISVPGEAKLSMIRKLLPGEQLDGAVLAFEKAVAKADLPDGISVSINYPAGRDHPKGGSPVEIPTDAEPALMLQDCVRSVRTGGGQIGGAPYWSEMPFLVNALDCPTVYCAPGDISVAHTFEERIEVEEYLDAVRVFALFIAAYCGVRQRT